MQVVSNSEGESFQKIFLAKIELGQGSGKCSDFWSAIAKIKGIVFWAVLPGAQALTGFRSQQKEQTWLVQTYKQYFIEQTVGKSWREC